MRKIKCLLIVAQVCILNILATCAPPRPRTIVRDERAVFYGEDRHCCETGDDCLEPRATSCDRVLAAYRRAHMCGPGWQRLKSKTKIPVEDADMALSVFEHLRRCGQVAESYRWLDIACDLSASVSSRCEGYASARAAEESDERAKQALLVGVALVVKGIAEGAQAGIERDQQAAAAASARADAMAAAQAQTRLQNERAVSTSAPLVATPNARKLPNFGPVCQCATAPPFGSGSFARENLIKTCNLPACGSDPGKCCPYGYPVTAKGQCFKSKCDAWAATGDCGVMNFCFER